MLRKIVFLTILLLLIQLSTHAQESRITDIAWNTDGTLLAIGWDDINAPLEIHNIVTGESYFYDIGLTPDEYSVSMVLAWSPTTSNRIAVADLTSWVSVFTIEDEELQLEYVFDDFLSNSRIDWNTDGTRIAIIGANGCCANNVDGIQIRDTDTGRLVAERGSGTPYTYEVDWHPHNPDLLVYTTFTNTETAIFQWDISTDSDIWTTGYIEDASLHVAWNPVGTMIGGFGSTRRGDVEIHLYDGATGEITSTFGQQSEYYTGKILWLDDSHILVDTGNFEVWQIETQQLIYQIEDAQYIFDWHPISGLAYVNNDGDLIILAPEDIPGIK